MIFFPSIEKATVRRLIEDLFSRIKDKIPLEDYVLDLMVDFEQGKALVIELNPFGKPDGMGTGTGLFNRENKADLDILFGSAKEFELRIVESAPNININTILRDGPLKTFLQKENLI